MTSMMGIPGASVAPATTSRGLRDDFGVMGSTDGEFLVKTSASPGGTPTQEDPGLTTGQKFGLGAMATLILICWAQAVAR